ncbi:hypothetical protein TWF730_010014 [Orbilia blumenaviensis]|uniref:F-box domain-containing protein n=1 Tax=Orbilia blumenaviensis TaxID=1796055 RepID=A0AAV9UVY2_9PEZI
MRWDVQNRDLWQIPHDEHLRGFERLRFLSQGISTTASGWALDAYTRHVNSSGRPPAFLSPMLIEPFHPGEMITEIPFSSSYSLLSSSANVGQNDEYPAHIPYLPNEIIFIILQSFFDDAPTGNCFDDPELGKFILSLRLVSQNWNALTLHTFLRHTTITSGFFPPEFTTLDLSTGCRAPSQPTETLVGLWAVDRSDTVQLYSDLQDLHRSDFFLSLSPWALRSVRKLTIHISCTIGDMDASILHRRFALAAMGCLSLEVLDINAHGMWRLDNPDNGLDSWFMAWNWDDSANGGVQKGGVQELKRGYREPARELWRDGKENIDHGEEGGDESMTRSISCNSGDSFENQGLDSAASLLLPRPEGPIFPCLKELSIYGYTRTTTLSDGGAADLLHFILRHGDTLEKLTLKNIGRRDNDCRPNVEEPSEKDDKLEGLAYWTNFRNAVFEGCGKLKEEAFLMAIYYTIVRCGPMPRDRIGPVGGHLATHHYDWPYETDVQMSAVPGEQELKHCGVVRSCGCQPAQYIDPCDGEGRWETVE